MNLAAGWPRKAARGLALVLMAGLLGLTSATTYRLLAPGEMFAQADLVFTGRVVDVVAEFRDDKAYPGVYTRVTFDVDELFRGFGVGEPPPPNEGDGGSPDEAPEEDVDLDLVEMRSDSLELDFLGGTAAGDQRLIVAGSPSWRTGETVLVAAHLDPDLASPLVGFRQGLWRMVDDAFVDEDGFGLGLDAAGHLARAELPGNPAEVLAAVRSVVAGEVPEEAPSDVPEEPAEEPAEDPAVEPPAGQSDEQGPPEPDQPSGEGPNDEPVDEGEDAPAEEASDAPEELAQAVPEAPLEPIAASYRVDDSGGPLLLSDAVAGAATEWRALAGEAVDLVADDASSNSLSYGPAALFSVDTLSLTLVDGAGSLTALLSPTAGDLIVSSIHHELGLILGLPAGGSGVMAMTVDDGPAGPGDEDLQALLAVNRYAPTDLSHDGVVDFDDLLLFAVNHGRSGLNLPGDLDGDGDVDDDDLEMLRDGYQLTPPRRP